MQIQHIHTSKHESILACASARARPATAIMILDPQFMLLCTSALHWKRPRECVNAYLSLSLAVAGTRHQTRYSKHFVARPLPPPQHKRNTALRSRATNEHATIRHVTTTTTSTRLVYASRTYNNNRSVVWSTSENAAQHHYTINTFHTIVVRLARAQTPRVPTYAFTRQQQCSGTTGGGSALLGCFGVAR